MVTKWPLPRISLRDFGYLIAVVLIILIVLRELHPDPYVYPLLGWLVGMPILLRFDQRKDGGP